MANAPFMYWVGMNTAPDLSDEDFQEFNNFYSNVHIHEVVEGNPGFFRATRFELTGKDPRNDYGPRWLAMYEMDSKAAADGYIERNDGPPEGRNKYTRGLEIGRQTGKGRWRLIWERLRPREGEIGGNGADFIRMIAMTPAPGTDEKGLKEFNDFYNDIHVPEVLKNGGWVRGTRYQLYREFVHDEPGAPQYLAVYEGDASTKAFQDARKGGGPSPIVGPPSWEGRTTLWRLNYRRVHSWTPGDK
jgi:hypothetical protein